MTDLSVTAANVAQGTGAQTESGVAGATITAGQPVYLDTTTQRYKLSDADSATVAARSVRGISLNGGSDGQPLTIQKMVLNTEINIGATLVANTAYYLSSNAGGICPLADVGTGEYMVLIGIARTAALLRMGGVETTVAN